MLRPLLQLSSAAVRSNQTDATTQEKNKFTAQMSNAEDVAGAVEVALAALTDRLAGLLAVPMEDIDSKRPITALGIDSLIALEQRQWIRMELKADATILDVMQSENVEALAKIVASRSELTKKTGHV
jgi:hypothetical protein